MPHSTSATAASPTLPRIRLLLVDDSALVREGIAAIIRSQAAKTGITIVREASSVATAIAASAQFKPDVILLDMRLPDGFGFTACREILRTQPHIHIIILTSYTDDQFIYESITAGTRGYLLKDIDPNGLITSIIKVASGESILSPDLTARVMGMLRDSSQQEKPHLLKALSAQENKVLELLSAGLTNKEIASQLHLSENTVKNYLATVFEKLHVSRRAQAAALYTSATKPSR